MASSRRTARAAAGAPPRAASRAPSAAFATPLALAAALATLTVVVYAGVWTFDFVSLDDGTYVAHNPHVAGGLTWAAMRWAFTIGYAANWHPLTWLSHLLDVTLFGVAPGPAHVVNLALHVANVLLLFWTLVRLTGATGRSAFVAALFAVHPAHVESVAWIAERKDVLSTCLWLLTLLAYTRYVRRRGPRRYLLVAGTFALGLMAKPMLVTLPFVLLLLDVWPLERTPRAGAAAGASSTWRVLIREKAPLFALSAASCVVTVVAQQRGGAVRPLGAVSVGDRLSNALLAYGGYLRMLVWPAHLSVYYAHDATSPAVAAIACAILLGGLTVMAVALRRSHPYVLVGWLWFLGTLVPVIGLVQVGRQAMADRYTYVPFIGLFVIVAWAASDVAARRRAPRWLLPAAAGLALLPLAIAAASEVQVWRDDASLWTRAIDVRLGLDAGRARLVARDLIEDRTLETFFASLETPAAPGAPLPRRAENLELAGSVLLRHHQLDAAAGTFREAIALAPASAPLEAELGAALEENGQPDQALSAFEAAVRLDPSLVQAQTDLGLTLTHEGRYAEALPHFAEVVRLRPNLADAHRNLALAFGNLGRIDDAMREFRAVLTLDPADTNVQRVLQEYARRARAPGGGKRP